jgi:acyl phosphate:glycerol-3-phosphate acyltransferase
MYISVIIKILFSYLLGSLSGSLILGKILNVDVRKSGSGNAGSTNAFRVMGAKFALLVLLIDISKGYFATSLIANVGSSTELLPILCGIAAITGHIFPIFYQFKGGKGAGAAIGMIFAIYPLAFLVAILTWLIILVFTGFVGLSTILASISVPLFTLFYQSSNMYFMNFSIVLAILIILTHIKNIKRMIKGTENRFEKMMIFKSK